MSGHPSDPDHLIPGVLWRRDPVAAAIPLVVDSPHNSTDWPADFDPIVSEAELMTSVDRFVDALFDHAPSVGATLIAAQFPRAYIDPNRAEDDLDLALIDGDWPLPVNPGEKTEYGMGVVRRYILKGRPIYDRKLTVAEVMHRLETYHRPYHAAVAAAIDAAHARFGQAFHIDCHSMKPIGNAMNVDTGAARPDMVLSDREGTTCDAVFIETAAGLLRDMGYRVSINHPYKGAELVARHSDPAAGRHSLQIELNRALYMDIESFEKSAGYDALKADLDGFLEGMAGFVRERVG
ncbi:N-formylglutamate amidohydrolase [Thalassobaculum litoreum]|uniref:N-formylglutamate deformylase n=1 Tax=Thalassobaculum litoreum DSM 18839 TaxID=1123362 RepID=A0A8G2BKM3_9PROT|nr:N-formylglutamate amidohydrolase [Thalassobaculum litoreum]SDG02301.1 N-formylglutamate deformylase [Thalassobaculum litoreum DSM 18839]